MAHPSRANLFAVTDDPPPPRRETPELTELMGGSAPVRALAAEVERVAPTDFAVLVCGETGTGKELVARALHARSRRAAGAFVALDCGAIPENLIESELFGHERGAFTGADRTRPGRFELAAGGTLFLDEISNLTPAMQAKLLRVLQERTFYRVGGTQPQSVDVRVLAATNRDLDPEAGEKDFRADLFHRLAEYVVHLPALRDRREDVPHLAGRFLGEACAELGKRLDGFSPAALEALAGSPWPGNVRELRNVIRRAALLADGRVEVDHLRSGGRRPSAAVPPPAASIDGLGTLSLTEIVRRSTVAVEREVLRRVLHSTGGNKAEAARLLKVDYKTLHTKVKRHGIGRAAAGALAS